MRVLELRAKYPDADIRWEIVFRADYEVYAGRMWIDNEQIGFSPFGTHKECQCHRESGEDYAFENIYDKFYDKINYVIRMRKPETVLEKYP